MFEGARNNLPDEDAHRAALAILDLVKDLTQDDLLIILIAGKNQTSFAIHMIGNVNEASKV